MLFHIDVTADIDAEDPRQAVRIFMDRLHGELGEKSAPSTGRYRVSLFQDIESALVVEDALDYWLDDARDPNLVYQQHLCVYGEECPTGRWISVAESGWEPSEAAE